MSESTMMELLTFTNVLVTLFAGLVSVALLFYLIKLKPKSANNVNNKQSSKGKKKNVPPIPQEHIRQNDNIQKQANRKKVQENRWPNKSDAFQHTWMLNNYRGHTGQVLSMDFSGNNKYLASSAQDRTVHLWDIRDVTQRDHKSLRVNIDFDYATLVKWSPDSKAFIISKYNENTLEVYRVEKKKDGWLGQANKVMTFPKEHKEDIISIGIASNGKFIMSCSNKTDLILWTLKGQILARIDTYLMTTFCAKISPCSKFLAAAGFAPDVKVWEVIFNKSDGEFQEIKTAFSLSGHTSGIYDFAFDANSSHVATVSKDGTWKLFDIKVEYKKREDPHLQVTGKYERSSSPASIALSPNAQVVAIASGDTLYFYTAHDGQLDNAIENVYNDNITAVMFDPTGKYVFTTGGKGIRVFHNVTGYKRETEEAVEKLKQSNTSAMKERLERLISANRAFVDSIEQKERI